MDFNFVEEQGKRTLQHGDVIDPRDAIHSHEQVGNPTDDGLEAVGEYVEFDLLSVNCGCDVERIVLHLELKHFAGNGGDDLFDPLDGLAA
ncbi:MAG: hypothetical protein O3A00_12800, partial [Planctomycetota bacterium]|nr:hypothetical protein [Planctomycetota bacterium]